MSVGWDKSKRADLSRLILGASAQTSLICSLFCALKTMKGGDWHV